MAGWYAEKPVDTAFGDSDSDESAASDDITVGDMLRFNSVTEVSKLLRSHELNGVFKLVAEYYGDGSAAKNTLTKDDDEYGFVLRCSEVVLKIEVEKTKVHKFIRDHYAVRFPELASLTTDSVTYSRLVTTISNDMNLVGVAPELSEWLPSQVVVAVIAAASTTQGRELDQEELAVVQEACREMKGLEDAKQVLLEYIQASMPLIAPNLSAFIGTAITSQIFAIVGSVSGIAQMDVPELMALGSAKSTGGFKVTSVGFLNNVDLVKCQPPELRTRALRAVAQKAIVLARIDDTRRASDNSQGMKGREELKRRMLAWTDPLVQQLQSRQRGLANKTYERRTRKRGADRADEARQRKAINRALRGPMPV